MERLAVIDMGSNSFRLVVFQYEPGSWWSLADEIREATRVSAGMGEEGVLKPGPMDRAIHTAAVFASFLEASGVDARGPGGHQRDPRRRQPRRPAAGDPSTAPACACA